MEEKLDETKKPILEEIEDKIEINIDKAETIYRKLLNFEAYLLYGDKAIFEETEKTEETRNRFDRIKGKLNHLLSNLDEVEKRIELLESHFK